MTVKNVLTAVTPIEHNVISGFANVARQFKGEGATILARCKQ